MNTTEMKQSLRIIKLFTYIIRNKNRKLTAKDLNQYMNQFESVNLRSTQRDLHALVSDESSGVIKVPDGSRRYYYTLEPNLSLSIPPARNHLMAFFLVKKLQPFIKGDNSWLESMEDLVSESAKEREWDLFEDLDSKFSKQTTFLGEISSFSPDSSLFDILISAIIENKKLKIKYFQTSGKEKDMEISPVKLILFKSELYFVCVSRKHNGDNFYIKLSRVMAAELLDEKFIPEKSEIKRVDKRLKDSFGILDDEGAKPVNVKIRFPLGFGPILSERVFHHTQKVRKTKEGDLLFTMKVPIGIDLVQWVLSWSDTAEVIGPVALKNELYQMGERLIRLYR